jgi:predicted RNA-binding Zn ribbon-like protein
MSSAVTAHAWALPDEPLPVRLMNTIWADTHGIHDDLLSPRDLDAWLDAVQIDRDRRLAKAEELAFATGLRDALRRLAAHLTTDNRVAAASAMTDVEDAIRTVNAVAARAPAEVLRVDGDRLNLGVEPGVSPVTAGLAHVARSAMRLFAGDEPVKLRACNAPGCVLYFCGTHPRREWCSISCGNRARAARHYQRNRAHR